MIILHIVPGANDNANGMATVARLLAKEQGDAEVVDLNHGIHGIYGSGVEEIWIHGMWLLKEWVACFRAHKAGIRLVRMTHGSLSPVYLKYQSPIKKWFVGAIERYFLRRCEKIVATCDAEKEWIEAYLGKRCPEIVVEDIKRFFDLNRVERVETCRGEGCFGRVEGEVFGFRVSSSELERDESNSQLTTHNSRLNLLYLGRRHPLKGVEYLEKAVKELGVRSQGLRVRDVENNSKLETRNLELKIVSNAFGEELEKVWEWCDVLVLPTLSENFGLVVAEALERGKRVITTDGAPVWGEESDGVEEWVSGGVESRYGGRLLYLKGYRDGADSKRVELLKKAIHLCLKD